MYRLTACLDDKCAIFDDSDNSLDFASKSDVIDLVYNGSIEIEGVEIDGDVDFSPSPVVVKQFFIAGIEGVDEPIQPLSANADTETSFNLNQDCSFDYKLIINSAGVEIHLYGEALDSGMNPVSDKSSVTFLSMNFGIIVDLGG